MSMISNHYVFLCYWLCRTHAHAHQHNEQILFHIKTLSCNCIVLLVFTKTLANIRTLFFVIAKTSFIQSGFLCDEHTWTWRKKKSLKWIKVNVKIEVFFSCNKTDQCWSVGPSSLWLRTAFAFILSFCISLFLVFRHRYFGLHGQPFTSCIIYIVQFHFVHLWIFLFFWTIWIASL